VVLYRREWKWVHFRLTKMTSPSLEFQTFAKRVKLALETKTTDPFNITITENQTEWINSRCKLLSFHQRTARK
jgi:hypothetical protein